MLRIKELEAIVKNLKAQPKVFTNILDTFWWSMVTFTTVGYGDMVPITPMGKFISSIVVLIGIMLFALPTSILTAEFLNEFQNNEAKEKKEDIKNKKIQNKYD